MRASGTSRRRERSAAGSNDEKTTCSKSSPHQRLDARVGLELDVEHPAAREQAENLFERRDLVVGERRAEPRPGVEARDDRKVGFPYTPRAVGGAIERLIVKDDRDLVPRQLDVELDHVGAEVERLHEGNAGIFGRDSRCSAMSDGQHRMRHEQ
jgi:hypothetical protein